MIEGAGFRLVGGPGGAGVRRRRSRHWSRSISRRAFSRTGRRCRAKADRPRARSCSIVGRLGVGLDNIAVDEATRRGIWVTNVPDYCFEEVADHSVGMLLAFTRGLLHFDREVQAGRWEPSTARLRRMRTLTVRHRWVTGASVGARRRSSKGFGARVLAYTRSPQGGRRAWSSLRWMKLLRQSDAVIVHIPLTPQTKHLLNRERLALDEARARSS